MQIKEGMEQRYAEFTASQKASADGQALVRFIETWSGMMECAVEHGAENIPEAASLTVRAAEADAGITEDRAVAEGAVKLLECWAHERGFREWYLYHPPEIFSSHSNTGLELFYSSRELRGAVPAIVEAYPCIREASPDFLEAYQILLPSRIDHSTPTLSM